jgi:tetratricopeptide (TPR) repeat protein
LLALGLSAISAYLLLLCARLFYAPGVRSNHWQLKDAKRVTADGVTFGFFSVALVGWLAYAAVLQFHAREAASAFDSALRGSGDREAAISRGIGEYRSAISMSPVVVAEWEGRLGSLLLARGELGEALEHLTIAVERSPDAVDLRYTFGRVLYDSGRFSEAAEQFRFVARRPERTDAFADLLDALCASGQPGQAVALGRDYVATHRIVPNVWHAYARSLIAAGVAAEEARRLAALGEAPEALYMLAAIYYERGDLATAKALYRRAQDLQPEIPQQ